MRHRLPLIFIIVTVMIDAMGIGLILPVMPDLLRELTGEGIAEAAEWGGLLVFCYSAMQVLFQPLIGNLSDRYGRRPVLLASLVAIGIDYVIMAVAGSLWLLFLARLVSGIAGATYSTAYALIADVSAKDKRAANFGLIGAAFGIGFILGPMTGGLLGELGTRAPFLAAGLLALLNAAFGLAVLTETLAAQNRRRFDWRRANPLLAVARIAALPQIGPLVLVFFIYVVAHMVYPVIWSYFAVAQYGWSPGMTGLSLGVVGVFMALTQGWLIRPALARLGEVRTALSGLVLNVAMMALLPFLWNGWVALAFAPVMAAGVIVTPALQGLMANRTGDDAQGELQGVVASAQGLASLVAPLVMSQTFRAFTAEGTALYLPGAPFLVAAALCTAALLLLLRERPAVAARRH
ncbi:MAG TPA: TCR/Tet family MFS transporter [Paracoccaceae bacterium]|nr:TCR/Tet family MFS transporter [Paracoccaceae bacterium]